MAAYFCIAALRQPELLRCDTNIQQGGLRRSDCGRGSGQDVRQVPRRLIQIKPRKQAGKKIKKLIVSAFSMAVLSDQVMRKSMGHCIKTKNAVLHWLAVVALAIACTAGVRAEQPGYKLDIEIDVPKARLIGTATIDSAKGAELSIYRGDLRILSLTTGSRHITPDAKDPDPFTLQAEGPVTIRFEGTFSGSEDSVISEDTIVLRDIWYPVVEGTYRYRLTATLPREFVAFSEADRVRRTEAGGQATYSFDLPHPQRDWDGITFAASKQWVSRTTRYRDVDLSVHLLHRNGERLDEMMRDTQRYLERLEQLLGTYPFKRLAIVENPVPIKYSLSMPTYILLSQKSVASTVREDSALDHEITHQWIGNGVLGDYDGGNWVEGLTSYLSDHLENEALGIAWERRQRMMAAYQNNVADRAPSPLSDFSESSDRPSKIIGYAKSAIVFHMLRRTLGDERFFAVMRGFVRENLFRAVSWTDIRRTFERASATDLGWFFDRWVDGVAIPELGLEGVFMAPAGNRHELRFTVTQKPPALPLTVPVTLYFEKGGSKTVVLQVPGERQEFHYLLNEKPVRVVLDENYDVFRRLTPAEIPPTINTLLTRPRVTVIAPPAEQAKFDTLLDAFEREGAPIALDGWGQERAPRDKPAVTAAHARLPGRATAQRELRRAAGGGAELGASGTSLILLGENNPLVAGLFGHVDFPRGGFTITVLKHPRSPGDVVAILTAASKAEVDAAYGTLIDSPRYSSAAFNGGKLTSYELRSGQRGISREVATERR